MDAHLSTHLDPHDHSTWFISTRPQKVSLWQGDKKGRAHCIASHRTAHIYARHIMARASASDVTRGASLAEWLVPGGLKLDFFFDSAKCFCAFPIIQSNPEDSISQKKKGGDKSRPDSPLPERLVRFISLFSYKLKFYVIFQFFFLFFFCGASLLLFVRLHRSWITVKVLPNSTWQV